MNDRADGLHPRARQRVREVDLAQDAHQLARELPSLEYTGQPLGGKHEVVRGATESVQWPAVTTP